MHTHEAAAQSSGKTTAGGSYATEPFGGSATFAFNDQRPTTVAQLKLQEMADEFSAGTAAGPVVQRVKLVDRQPAKKGRIIRAPRVVTSEGFDTNHLAADDVVTDDLAKARRAVRKMPRNTIVKKSALEREAKAKRSELTTAASGMIGLPKSAVFNFQAGEAKTAVYNGTKPKNAAANATVSDTRSITVMAQKPDDATVEIHHLDDSEPEAPPAVVPAIVPVEGAAL